MKQRNPKPVVLEPAFVGLLRLGREMGSSDIPSAQLVSSPLWSMEASREVDRIAGEQEERDRVESDMRLGLLLGKRCFECGERCTPFGTAHLPGCDIDTSITAQQRWKLRNPARAAGYARITKIKRRWALLLNRGVTLGTEAARAA